MLRKSFLLFLTLLVGDAVCLAASAPASASSSSGSSSNAAGAGGGGRKPPPPSQPRPVSRFDGTGRNNRRSSSNLPKIACVISTKKDGGESRAFAFPTSAAAIGANFSSDASGGLNASQTEAGLVKAYATPRYPHHHHRSIFRGVQSGLYSTFLPSGFPSSTPDGYLPYSAWSWIQDLSTQLRGVVATQRILQGVGVGKEGATALSALYHYLTRDGCGMVATLAFTRFAASRFRTDVKRWRLLADVMVDVGMTLEVAAVQAGEAWFLPMICLGNMAKAICGVAAGACNGAIHLHWARGSDISDINAKFGAQQTVTGSLGLIAAAFFARSVSEIPPARLWILYGLLTAIHLYANTRCMRRIEFDYMNQERLRMVVADYLARPSVSVTADEYDDEALLVPTPRTVAEREPLWFITPRKRTLRERMLPRVPIEFGVSFEEFTTKSGWTEADTERALMVDGGTGDPSYVISTGRDPRSKRLVIVVALVNHATGLQQTKAYFHALLLKRRLGEVPTGLAGLSTDSQRLLERETAEEVEREWIGFWRASRMAGWDLKKSELRSKGYEITVQYRNTPSSSAP